MSTMSNSNKSTEEIDYDFADTIRLHYPALYQKDSKEYSNRDTVKNCWKGLCTRMGIKDVEVARQWWTRLLNEYSNEKKRRVQERKSGSGASIKREHFGLHDLMKDMLSRTSSNYQSKVVDVRNDDSESQEKIEPTPTPQHSDDSCCYNSSKASGRRGRKKLDLATTFKEIGETVHGVRSAMDLKTQEGVDENADGNVNRDIGDLIFSELQKMESLRANEKRNELMTILYE